MNEKRKEEIRRWSVGYSQGQSSTAYQYITELLEALNKYEKTLIEISKIKDEYGLHVHPAFIAQDALKELS